MNKLNKIISAIVVTAMLTLPVFGAIIKIKPNDVSWNSGPSQNDGITWTG